MKVGIVTIDSRNYGNRLQNYAVQRLLEKRGCTVCTFKRDYNFCNSLSSRKVFVKTMLAAITPKSKNVKWVTNANVVAFMKFNSQFINWDTRLYPSQIDSNYLNDEYDLIVCGSDQIWNNTFFFFSESDFVNYNLKIPKIALSVSIGMESLDEDMQEIVKKWIPTFDSVSVREYSARDLLKPYYEKDILVCCDPTLLLSKEEWDEIVVKPGFTLDRYILLYFLGERSKAINDFIADVANKNKLRIIDLSTNQGCVHGIGPSEFVWYIKNAEFIFTDSFHASIFSVIYKKRFSVYDRCGTKSNMNNRIVTLLDMLRLKSRYNILSYDVLESEIEYEEVEKQIMKEQEKMNEFIHNVLKNLH